ncbi:MAG: helix-turn-helix transcriptional regulator [Clostridia bacterium]|nr:helix-turn-helix transcriptional regulator [Clostridia bacterium]
MLRLKELRKKRGFSQAELAGRLGVPQQTYSNWENEVREMDYKTLIRMAVIFGVSVDYLLGRPVKNIEEEQK